MMLRTLLVALLCLQVGACGWHLRGMGTTPLDVGNIYLFSNDRYSDFYMEFRQVLEQSQSDLVDTASAADYQVMLLSENQSRRVASVSSDALASEYELTLEVKYQISDGEGKLLIPATSAEVVRTYQYDRNALASQGQEQTLILREMRKAAADQILRQLRFLSTNMSADENAAISEDNGEATP